MSDKEYKSYDSPFRGEYAACRLAKDAEVREGEYGNMVRLTTVATSKNDRFSDLWVDINVSKFNAGAAAYLQKGDVIDLVEGRIAMRKWGDDNENQSISLEQATLTMRPSLLADLKERGWEPGADSDEKPKKKGGKDSKPAKKDDKKKSGKPAPKKEILEIPDEDEDESDGEEESEDEE